MFKTARFWAIDHKNLLFVLLIVLHLIPLWVFKYFPSQDGPAHLANANIIREYRRPDLPIFRMYYVINEMLTPNWVGHLILAGLLSLMPMLVAEKVFLSAYVILLPLSTRYVISAVRPESGFLSVLAFPFIYNYLIHMGFYSFSYSLVMFFFVFGYWLKYREDFTIPRIAVLAFLSLLIYFAHIISMLAAYVAITLMTIWSMVIKDFEKVNGRQFSLPCRSDFVRMLRPFLAFLPTLTMCGVFTLQKTALAHGVDISWEDKPSPKMLLNQLLSAYSLVSYNNWEMWLSRAFSFLFAAVIAYLILSGKMCFRPTFQLGFLFLAATYAVIYVIGPSEIGGGSYIHDRINLYPFLTLIIWFAAHSYSRMARRFIPGAAISIALAMLALHSAKYKELNHYLAEYMSGMHYIEPNTTLLPIAFSRGGDTANGRSLSLRIDFVLNAAGYIATEKRVIDLGNYEASQTNHFPILFRPELNPAVNLYYAPLDIQTRELRAIPTEIAGYQRCPGRHIDYVLLWGVRDRDRDKAIPRLIFKQLHEAYDLIYTSPQHGLMQLYRRKDLNIES